ncbi:MAG: hypothetical protein KDK07_03680 [Bauldia sp.]|nr:hypothetical protein [Bauldia sp.]
MSHMGRAWIVVGLALSITCPEVASPAETLFNWKFVSIENGVETWKLATQDGWLILVRQGDNLSMQYVPGKALALTERNSLDYDSSRFVKLHDASTGNEVVVSIPDIVMLQGATNGTKIVLRADSVTVREKSAEILKLVK